jgi:hypothetical protein
LKSIAASSGVSSFHVEINLFRDSFGVKKLFLLLQIKGNVSHFGNSPHTFLYQLLSIIPIGFLAAQSAPPA